MIKIKMITTVNTYNEALNFVKTHRFINDGDAITVRHGVENTIFVAIGKTLFKFVLDKEYNFAEGFNKEFFGISKYKNEYKMFVAADMSARIHWHYGDISFSTDKKLCMLDEYGNIYVAETRKYVYELGLLHSKVSDQINTELNTNYIVPIYKARIDNTFSEIRKRYLSVGETISIGDLEDGPVAVIYVNGEPRPERYVKSAERNKNLVTAKIYFKNSKSEDMFEVDCNYKERIILSIDPERRKCEETIFNTDVFVNTSFVKNVSDVHTLNFGSIKAMYSEYALIDCSIADGVIYADVYQLDTGLTDMDQLKKAKIIKPMTSNSNDLVLFN